MTDLDRAAAKAAAWNPEAEHRMMVDLVNERLAELGADLRMRYDDALTFEDMQALAGLMLAHEIRRRW